MVGVRARIHRRLENSSRALEAHLGRYSAEHSQRLNGTSKLAPFPFVEKLEFFPGLFSRTDQELSEWLQPLRDPGGERAETRQQVKDQLEALILQMYKSNILYSEAVREFKKNFIMTVLEENRGNQCKAARQLGMHRNTLSRTMQELKIDVRPLRAGAKRPPRSARPATLERKQVR